MGLARALSKLGFCSRAQAFDWIRAGKVRLNGSMVKNPEAGVRIGKDRIEVEGKRIGAAEKVYVVLNKPRGVITSAADERGRKTVYSLLPAYFAPRPPAEAWNYQKPQGSQTAFRPAPQATQVQARAAQPGWIAPVGRLDQASEGLLLLTNDSEWAARITDPDSHLDKTYHVQIGTVAEKPLIERLERGVEMPDGEMLKAKRAALLRAGEKRSWLEIVLDEGKNRQIRRMLDALGVEALRLVRIAIGPLQLGKLAKGGHRELRPEEKRALDAAL